MQGKHAPVTASSRLVRRPFIALIALLISVLTITGCGDSDNTSDANSATGGTSTGGSASTGGTSATGGTSGAASLAACSNGASDAALNDQTLITEDYAQSLHEMVACGGLTASLCNGVISGIINAIVSELPDATPRGWSYRGDGLYYTGDGGMGVDMEARFFLAEDFSFGTAGSPLTEVIFLVENYLRGGRVSVDFIAQRAEVSYDSVGPLVELLGFGAEPPNPIVVTLSDLSSLQGKLRALQYESVVVVDDEQSKSTVRYHVTTPRLPVDTIFTGQGMSYDLVEASASRADLGQSLSIISWSVEYVDGGSAGNLNGAAVYRVEGGDFTFEGTATFEESTFAETTLRCPM